MRGPGDDTGFVRPRPNAICHGGDAGVVARNQGFERSPRCLFEGGDRTVNDASAILFRFGDEMGRRPRRTGFKRPIAKRGAADARKERANALTLRPSFIPF